MWSVVATLAIAWLLALLSSMTYGGWVHLLPVAAVALAAEKLIRDRRARL